MTTVCQANASIMPRLKDGGSRRDVPGLRPRGGLGRAEPRQAQAHVVAGEFGTPSVTLELATPRGEPAVAVHAAAHVLSGNPPRPEVKYQIEYSTDAAATWTPVVKDWTIPAAATSRRTSGRRACAGARPSCAEATAVAGPGPVPQRRRQAPTPAPRPTWSTGSPVGRDGGHLRLDRRHRPSPRLARLRGRQWKPPPGTCRPARGVRTRWVEFEPVAAR